jgi:hypothetical protein
MTDLPVGRSRLAGTLTTPDDTDDTAGVDSTIRHRPDAVVCAASEPDVVETVRFARAEGMPLQLHVTERRTTAPSGHRGRPHQPGPPDRLRLGPPWPPSHWTPITTSDFDTEVAHNPARGTS